MSRKCRNPDGAGKVTEMKILLQMLIVPPTPTCPKTLMYHPKGRHSKRTKEDNSELDAYTFQTWFGDKHREALIISKLNPAKFIFSSSLIVYELASIGLIDLHRSLGSFYRVNLWNRTLD